MAESTNQPHPEEEPVATAAASAYPASGYQDASPDGRPEIGPDGKPVQKRKPAAQGLSFDQLDPAQQGLAMLFFFLAMLLDPKMLENAGLDKLFGSILGLDPNKGESFGKWQKDAVDSGKSPREIARGHDYRNFNFGEAAMLAASDTPILELIGKHESGGDYNNYYGRSKKGENVNFSNMTVDQVLAWQRDHTKNDGYASSAAGKYQVIQKTLEACKKEMRLTGSEKFDPAMQDKIAIHLMNKRGYQDFLKGSLSAEKFAHNLSQEWASLPKNASGLSYYHGDGLNKAGVGWGEVLASIQGSRNAVRSPAFDAQIAAKGGPLVLSLPLDSKMTSDMGPRNTGIGGASKNHGGIDMRAAIGTPLLAQGSTQVAYAGPSAGYGQAVILNHGQGVFTLYGHVEPNMPARTGQVLKAGDKFAVTGNEGVGNAPHLHFEILLQGRDGRAYRVDPEAAIGKDLADPNVRQALIEHSARKMGVSVNRLASQAFDSRVADNLKQGFVARAEAAPPAAAETKVAKAETAPESRPAPVKTAAATETPKAAADVRTPSYGGTSVAGSLASALWGRVEDKITATKEFLKSAGADRTATVAAATPQTPAADVKTDSAPKAKAPDDDNDPVRKVPAAAVASASVAAPAPG